MLYGMISFNVEHSKTRGSHVAQDRRHCVQMVGYSSIPLLTLLCTLLHLILLDRVQHEFVRMSRGIA